MASSTKYRPDEDGVKHINIYSKSRCDLGRFLSNFTDHPVVTKHDGMFHSIEGYWYWLGLSEDCPKRDQLREVSGYGAKALGRALRGNKPLVVVDDFMDRIRYACLRKVATHPTMLIKLKQSIHLPFAHYYEYGGRVIEPEGSQWLIQMWDSIRTELMFT